MVWSFASFRLLAESKRALTSGKNSRFDLLSIDITCWEKRFPGTHSGRLNIAGWNMNTYFLLLLQHVQYFHCYVSLHEASHRFFLNNVSGVKRIFQITPALADIFPSVGFAEILASIFFQKVKEDVKQQKDEAKWINEIVSLMVDGWFLFVCLWGCTFTFLQMGHILICEHVTVLTFIQTNVSCFFFRRGAVRLYKRCCCRFNISSCSINIRFTKQDATCKNSASNHQMQALQRQK